MRTPLTPAELAQALEQLPDWSGDTNRISRTVHLPPARDAVLRAAVAQVADEADHHPVVEDLPDGGSRFVLWTHVRNAVTEQDTALAARIDAVVAACAG